MNTIHNSIERRNYLQFDVLVKQKIGLDRKDKKGLTPLMKANHEPKARSATEMVRLLLLQQADVTMFDNNGRTALMHSALVGNAASFRLICNAGVNDPVLRDHQGNAVVHYAAMSGDLATIEEAINQLTNSRIKIDLRNDQGMTPLHVACSQGHVKTARYLHFEGNCSLVLRDGVSDRSARDWLEEACDMPLYMDPFNPNADIEQITPKEKKVRETYVDSSKIRIFLLMKEKPEIDEDVALPNVKPPWDINTNVKVAPKYNKNGSVNPYRFRKTPALICAHFTGTASLRPFSAPCGYPEFSQWKHPLDVKPFLANKDMASLRRYSSVTDMRKSENNVRVREHVTRLLNKRG